MRLPCSKQALRKITALVQSGSEEDLEGAPDPAAYENQSVRTAMPSSRIQRRALPWVLLRLTLTKTTLEEEMNAKHTYNIVESTHHKKMSKQVGKS